ncbi:MAG: DNA polymerase III subunit chi [Methylococcaceae bacterium]|nr:DNA polymerase III subunit chi [Methylococcaceae bacterium]
MPEASFYILPTDTLSERYLFACKLIEKAYRSGQFCYVYTDSHQQSELLDDQLWTFRENSFIPHQIYEENTPKYERTILIGTKEAPQKWKKLIFNLSSKYPDNLDQTERVLEILDNNEELKLAGRHRFRRYTQNGFNMTTHNMNEK